MTELREGDILDGRYRIGPRIARGGMSAVHRAVDLRLGRRVAAKVMDPRFHDDIAFRTRFEREARAVAAMSDPTIVNVYDQGADEAGHVFLIMELVDGGTLRELLRERGPMPPHAAAAVLRPVLCALTMAHRRGLVHRDVKPENVLISDSGQVKLADFGLVRAAADASVTSDSVIVGTVAYLAPEQVRGGESGPAADVYSAGVLLYEVLTGSTPFTGDTSLAIALQRLEADVPAPSAAIDGVPTEFDALVARACARNPADRYANAGEFLDAVEEVAAELNLPAFTVPAPVDSAAHRAARASASTHPDDAARPRHAREEGLGDAAAADAATPADAQGTDVLPAVPPAGLFGPHDGPAGDGMETRFDAPLPAAPVGDGHTAALPRPGLAADDGEAWSRADWNDDHFFDPDDNAGDHVLERPRSSRSPATSNRTGASRERTRTGCAIWLIIALIATLAMGLGAWWFGSGRYGEVPTLVGMSPQQAKAAVTDAGFTPASREIYDDEVPASQVAGADPAAGSKVVRGDTVTVLISLGRPTVPTIPAHADSARYTQLLEQRTLVARQGDPVYSDTVKEGGVATAEPSPGSTVRTGSTVTLHLSRGPEPTTVPDIIGLDRADAEKALERAKLRVGTVSERFDAGADPEEVLQTQPNAGEEAEKDSEVDIIVNSALKVPDVAGMKEDKAAARLREAGFAVREVEVDPGSSRPAGEVERTAPASGQVVDPANPGITIYVSETVEVPRLIGRTLTEAREEAGRHGLRLSTPDGANARDRVITQSPMPGGSARKGDTISVGTL